MTLVCWNGAVVRSSHDWRDDIYDGGERMMSTSLIRVVQELSELRVKSAQSGPRQKMRMSSEVGTLELGRRSRLLVVATSKNRLRMSTTGSRAAHYSFLWFESY